MAHAAECRVVAAPICAAHFRNRIRARRNLFQAAIAFVCLVAAVSAFAAPRAQDAYEHAEQLRAELNSKPAPRRTRSDYRLVLDAYKVIYHGMPMSPHAVDSILATAQVLEDEGRVFRDPKLFMSTVNEYEYLRQHYPANAHRAEALLAEARVEQHELRDAKTAEQKYREVLARYPGSPEAGDAKTALADLGAIPPANNTPAEAQTADTEPTPQPAAPPANTKPSAAVTPQQRNSRFGSSHITAVGGPANVAATGEAHRTGAAAHLTGIRQLVSEDEVQLVFDLSGPASFRTGRATNPTRIYFDLENTRVDKALTLHPMLVSADPAQQWLVHRIRAAQTTPTTTRVVLEVDDSADAYAQLQPGPWRLMVDIHSVSGPNGSGTPPKEVAQVSPPAIAANSPYASQGQEPSTQVGYVPGGDNSNSAGTPPAPVAVPPQNAAPNLNNANLTTHASATGGSTTTTTSPPAISNFSQASPASPTSNGNSTLVRALGLKIGRVVIDAGHGGHDTGTIGPDGLAEKDVVLDVALRLGAELQQRLGVQVVYTRSTDVFIPLEQRTAIANDAHADLFISIHGNSSPETNVRGVETYYLSLTNQKDALEVASRENATSAEGVHDLADIVKRITTTDKITESHEFANDVQQQLYNGLVSGNAGLKDRGIKKAPFIVLIGANMPSILTEISFVTNSKDARELREPRYRQRIADSLFDGIAEYMSSLSAVHTKSTAQAGNKKSKHQN